MLPRLASEIRRTHRRSPFSRYLIESTLIVRTEEDSAISTPCPADQPRRIAKIHGRAASQIYPLQLSVGAEGQRAAIWWPEWRQRVVGFGQRLRVRGIEQ